MTNTIPLTRLLVAGAILTTLIACSPDPPPPTPSETSAAAVAQTPASPAPAPVAEVAVTPSPPPASAAPDKAVASNETAAAEACPDAAPRVRWLDSQDHVPLAIVEPVTGRSIQFGQVLTAPKGCCAAWRGPERVWTTVDAYGQPVGTAKAKSDWLYDATECYLPEFEQIEGEPGVGLYASSDKGYRTPRSLKWAPDAGQRAALEAMAKQLDGLIDLDDSTVYPDDEPLGSPLERALFFRGSHRADAPRLVAYGGRYLVIAALGDDGRWRMQHLDQSESRWSSGGNRIYRLRAVIDLDHDGDPEVIVHREEIESFSDIVIGFEEGGWRIRVESIGGAAI